MKHSPTRTTRSRLLAGLTSVGLAAGLGLAGLAVTAPAQAAGCSSVTVGTPYSSGKTIFGKATTTCASGPKLTASLVWNFGVGNQTMSTQSTTTSTSRSVSLVCDWSGVANRNIKTYGSFNGGSANSALVGFTNSKSTSCAL